MQAAYGKLRPNAREEPATEVLDSWFDQGAEDASPAVADGSKGGERRFKWFAGRIPGPRN